MEHQLEPAALLRFLQAEADVLQQMQAKISNELHHLQVEEEVFVRTIDRLNQNQSCCLTPAGATSDRNQAGLELLEALQLELASAVPPVSMLAPDSSPHTLPHSPPVETGIDGNVEVETQIAGPSAVGIGGEAEADEYELFGTLESGM